MEIRPIVLPLDYSVLKKTTIGAPLNVVFAETFDVLTDEYIQRLT
jgi:hypothetical protein